MGPVKRTSSGRGKGRAGTRRTPLRMTPNRLESTVDVTLEFLTELTGNSGIQKMTVESVLRCAEQRGIVRRCGQSLFQLLEEQGNYAGKPRGRGGGAGRRSVVNVGNGFKHPKRPSRSTSSSSDTTSRDSSDERNTRSQLHTHQRPHARALASARGRKRGTALRGGRRQGAPRRSQASTLRRQHKTSSRAQPRTQRLRVSLKRRDRDASVGSGRDRPPKCPRRDEDNDGVEDTSGSTATTSRAVETVDAQGREGCEDGRGSNSRRTDSAGAGGRSGVAGTSGVPNREAGVGGAAESGRGRRLCGESKYSTSKTKNNIVIKCEENT